ncbi:MAG TPA: alanine dehydrogenase [Chloroflexota bacterium]|nr:alanine dehydrogenase [Chloroflexota bacterium]
MIVGVPKEIKDSERRVAVTPSGAHALCAAGHTVVVQADAGTGSGFADAEYADAGARIEKDAAAVWAAEMVVKVKEPLPAEYAMLAAGQILFTYLHLAAEPELTRQLVERTVTSIAYETVQSADGRLPILEPMSEVAGRMAPQVAAQLLTHVGGGRGLLLAGVPGVAPARVIILGAGTVGANAARIALGMGADVTVFNRGLDRLRALDTTLNGRATTMAAHPESIAEAVQTADVVIGAALVTGARAPRLVTEAMVRTMRPGSVIVDVAVDQGGCVETIRPTSHTHPTYTLHDVVHYAVPNMPGAVPRTSTIALTNVTLPYVRLIAERGFQSAVTSPELAAGVNTYRGVVTHRAVAEAVGLPFVPLGDALAR